MGIRRWVCVLAAFSFALSHTWWLVSVVNESYTLNVFFIAVSLFIISIFERSTRKTILICAGSFVAGLSLTDSLLFLFLVPGVLYFFLSGKHKTFALKRSYIGILFFLLGNSLWGYEYIKNMIFLQHKTSLGFINMITYASMRYVKPALFIKESVKYIGYLFYQFPVFGFLIGCVGMHALYKRNRRYFYVAILSLVSFLLFGSAYMMQRKFFILAPTYFIFAIYIGMGVEFLVDKYSKKSFKILLTVTLILCPVFIYWITPQVLKKARIEPLSIRTLPYRDNTRFYLWPPKNREYGARIYGIKVLESMKPNSIILADFTPEMVLRYLQEIEGMRKDVIIEDVDRFIGNKQENILGFIDDHINNYPVYLADDESYYEMERIKAKYEVVKKDILYEVIKKTVQ